VTGGDCSRICGLVPAETDHLDHRPWSAVRPVPGLNAEFLRAGEEPGGEDEEDDEE
jgi:hypothetical protein